MAVRRSRHDVARRQQRASHQQPAVLLHAGARRSGGSRTASTRWPARSTCRPTAAGRSARAAAGCSAIITRSGSIRPIPSGCSRGTDGGFFISNDYGRNWDFVNNMPMAQAYHLGVDMAEPYNVMGGFQDHEIWRGPNEKWNQVGVREGDWLRLRYMADGMHTIADPRDPEHHLLQRALRRHHAPRHAEPRGALYPAVSARPERRRRDARPVSIQLELAGPHVADQPRRALLRRQRAVQDDRPRRDVVDHQPGSDHQRQGEAGGQRRRRSRTTTPAPSSTARSSRSPRARVIQRHLGGDRRWQRPGHARRRQDLDQRRAEHHRGAEVLLGLVDLGVQQRCRGRPTSRSISTASTTSRRTCSSRPTTARRGGGSPRASRLRPRREGRSEGAEPDLRRQRAGHLRLVRSRGDLERPALGLPPLAVVDLMVHPA